MRIALINPNTNAETTAAMVAIAREAAGDAVPAEESSGEVERIVTRHDRRVCLLAQNGTMSR